jgi:CRISPR-associated protein Cas1
MAIVQNLIVEEYGSFIGKHSERLIVTKGETQLAVAPLLHLETVLITGNGVSISADVVKECAERGIPIHFVSGTGNPYASLYSAGLTGTILTRRAQLEAFGTRRGLLVALACARGKIQNQANLLKYIAKYRKETAPELYDRLRRAAEQIEAQVNEVERLEKDAQPNATIDAYRAQVMGIEGSAAQMYWDAIGWVLPAEVEWHGRIGRGARDPVNSALNYAYGILYTQVERALILAGLDPYAGFAHVDRPGKPSMTLDAIEEFRQPVADRTVLGLVNKGVKIEQDEKGYLTEVTRKMLAEKVLNRLETPEMYEKKNVPLRIIVQLQARHLATFLRGEREAYRAFVMEW